MIEKKVISGCKKKEIFKNRFQDQNAENIEEQIARFRVQKNR